MQKIAFEPKISVFEILNPRAPDNETTRLTLPDHLEQNVISELYTSSVFNW